MDVLSAQNASYVRENLMSPLFQRNAFWCAVRRPGVSANRTVNTLQQSITHFLISPPNERLACTLTYSKTGNFSSSITWDYKNCWALQVSLALSKYGMLITAFSCFSLTICLWPLEAHSVPEYDLSCNLQPNGIQRCPSLVNGSNGDNSQLIPSPSHVN